MSGMVVHDQGVPATIDIVLDHHSATLLGGCASPSAVDLAPADRATAQAGLAAAHPAAVRRAERLDDAAIRRFITRAISMAVIELRSD